MFFIVYNGVLRTEWDFTAGSLVTIIRYGNECAPGALGSDTATYTRERWQVAFYGLFHVLQHLVGMNSANGQATNYIV